MAQSSSVRSPKSAAAISSLTEDEPVVEFSTVSGDLLMAKTEATLCEASRLHVANRAKLAKIRARNVEQTGE